MGIGPFGRADRRLRSYSVGVPGRALVRKAALDAAAAAAELLRTRSDARRANHPLHVEFGRLETSVDATIPLLRQGLRVRYVLPELLTGTWRAVSQRLGLLLGGRLRFLKEPQGGGRRSGHAKQLHPARRTLTRM
jgi:hypothetical protein